MSSLVSSAPALQTKDLKQIAALPLGGRIKLDVWSDQLSIKKTQTVRLMSANEKMPFEVTPMFPYLTRWNQAAPAGQAGSSNGTSPVETPTPSPSPQPH